MTPEDEKRLAEIRGRNEVCVGESHYGVTFLLAKLDEEKRARTEAEKENVRIAKQSAENRARAVRVEAALDYEKRIHTQTTAALAEERAKREAAEQQERQDVLQAEASAADSEREAVRERERADRAEATLRDGELRKREDYFPEVANLRQRNRDMHDRAQKAEATLAEAEAYRASAERVVSAAARKLEAAERERDEARLERQNADGQRVLAVRMLDEERGKREAADNDMCEEAGKRAAAEVRAETAEARVAELETLRKECLADVRRMQSLFGNK